MLWFKNRHKLISNAQYIPPKSYEKSVFYFARGYALKHVKTSASQQSLVRRPCTPKRLFTESNTTTGFILSLRSSLKIEILTLQRNWILRSQVFEWRLVSWFNYYTCFKHVVEKPETTVCDMWLTKFNEHSHFLQLNSKYKSEILDTIPFSWR